MHNKGSSYIETVTKLGQITTHSLEEALTHFSMGMVAELFEVDEVLDRPFSRTGGAYSGGMSVEYQMIDLKKELGDVIFYAYAFALRIGYHLDSEPDIPRVLRGPEGYLSPVLDRLGAIMRDHNFFYTFSGGHFPTLRRGIAAINDAVLKWRFHGAELELYAQLHQLTQILNSVYSFAFQHGINYLDILKSNQEKLHKRHPDGFRGVKWKRES